MASNTGTRAGKQLPILRVNLHNLRAETRVRSRYCLSLLVRYAVLSTTKMSKTSNPFELSGWPQPDRSPNEFAFRGGWPATGEFSKGASTWYTGDAPFVQKHQKGDVTYGPRHHQVRESPLIVT